MAGSRSGGTAGAILAVIVLYWWRFWDVLVGLFRWSARDGGGRSIAALIINASGSDLNVILFQLQGGAWIPPVPLLGYTLHPQSQIRYVTAVGDTLSTVGGLLTLSPASGDGIINLDWLWAEGIGLVVSGNISSTTLRLDFGAVNPGSDHAGARYLIQEIAAPRRRWGSGG